MKNLNYKEKNWLWNEHKEYEKTYCECCGKLVNLTIANYFLQEQWCYNCFIKSDWSAQDI